MLNFQVPPEVLVVSANPAFTPLFQFLLPTNTGSPLQVNGIFTRHSMVKSCAAPN